MINNFSQNYYSKLKLFCIFSIIFLIFYRSPYILTYGRFVAEEGSFFFKNSFEHGFLYGLTQIHFGSGYLNLWANICTAFASLAELEYAPLVTVYLNFLLIIFLIYYIIDSSSFILSNLFYKYLFCLLIIVSPLSAPEVWLNSINAQVYLGIFSIIIFLNNFHIKKKIHKLSVYTLFLSGLTSLYACVLTPFFYLKFKIFKNRTDLKNFFVLSICSLIQLSIFFYSKLNNLAYEGVRHQVSLEKLTSFYYNVLVKPLIGRENSYIFINNLKNLDVKILLVLFSILVSFILFYCIKYFIKKKDYIFFFLLCIFISETILIFYGSHNNHAGGRYSVVPGSIVFLILIKICTEDIKIIKNISLILIFVSIASGLYEFKNNNSYKNFLLCNNCPVWKDEIKIWRNNPQYKINIWNYPGESMSLRKIKN